MNSVRHHFPALGQQVHGHPLVYLDNAASTLKPFPVIRAMQRYYQGETANIHRGTHFLSEQGTHKYEQARKILQQFINAPSEKQILFTKGTTESINLVAQSWGEMELCEGDEILVSTMEHHSNIVPWQMIADKKKARVIEIPITDRGEIDRDAFEGLLGPRVKMVAMTHISNSLGTVNPVEELIPLVRKRGILFTLDAAQSAPHQTLDVQKLDCDFMVFSGHKMYAPTGIGVLYGRLELLEKMPPWQGGGAMISQVSFEGTTYGELPEKFEAGTPPIASAIVFKESVDYLCEIGFDAIYAREQELLEEATTKLSKLPGLRIIGTAGKKAPVISFVVEGLHPHDIGVILDRQGVAVRTGHHCNQPLMQRLNLTATVRASFSFYNNSEDIDRLVEALCKAKRLLAGST